MLPILLRDFFYRSGEWEWALVTPHVATPSYKPEYLENLDMKSKYRKTRFDEVLPLVVIPRYVARPNNGT